MTNKHKADATVLDIEQVRAGIPALSESIYLNTGTFGPLPRVVADEIRRVYDRVEQLGTYAPPVFREMELAGVEATRRKIADLMHAVPDEIALTHNVTDGINIILHGRDWSPGDEVIITDQEHPAGTVPWLDLAERRGIVIRWLPIGADPDDMTARFEALIGPRTRLACLSHVSCITGIRLPIAKLCAVTRAAGILSLIDGAHAEGQFPFNVPELGCDFYAGCGHKWLLGPQGTGFLYIRATRLSDVRPAWLGWGPNKAFDRQALHYALEPSAARFESSTQPWPLYLAFGRAIDYIQDIGLHPIETRVRQLVAHLRGLLGEIPGLTFHTPDGAGQAAGLLTCSIQGCNVERLSQQLWERERILIPANKDLNGLRFSVAFFNTTEELETAAAAICALAHRAAT